MSPGASRRSSAASTRVCTWPIQAAKRVAGSVIGRFTGKRLQRVLFQDFHLLLRLGEHRLAILGELETPFVRGKRLLERELPRFHAGDELLQLGERGLEARWVVGAGGFAHAIAGNYRETGGSTKIAYEVTRVKSAGQAPGISREKRLESRA